MFWWEPIFLSIVFIDYLIELLHKIYTTKMLEQFLGTIFWASIAFKPNKHLRMWVVTNRATQDTFLLCHLL